MSLLSRKKSKISRFVNEIRSSKRGESLVVEAGFPISLIDLFVKNRDRLNKSYSSKKSKKNRLHEQQPQKQKQISSTQLTQSTPLAPFILNSINALLCETEDSGKNVCVLNDIDEAIEDDQQDLIDDGDGDGDDGECVVGVSVRNRWFIIGIKLFVILILALVTRKLVIAITLSAFLLMFLEYFFELCKSEIKGGKRLVGGDKSIAVATNFVDVCEEFGGRKIIEFEFDSGEDDDDQDQETRILKDDEEIVEYGDIDLGRDDKICQLLDLDQDQDERVLKDGEEIVEHVNIRCSKRSIARHRTKQFKKFVVKKFGGESKNRRRNNMGNVDATRVPSEIERVVGGGTKEEKENEEENNVRDDEREGKVEDECDVMSTSDAFQENLGKTLNWSSRAFIPVVVILAGLVGGRIMALGLTIVWCVINKVLGAIRR